MIVLPININNNTNFKGSIDKSVYKYLNDIKKQTIKNRYICEIGVGNTSEESIRKTTDLISEILTKLKSYMEKTQKNTKIALEKSSYKDNLIPVFKNKITNTQIKGSSPHTNNLHQYAVYDTYIALPEPDLKASYNRYQKPVIHTLDELNSFLRFVNDLSSKCSPERIDFVLFKNMIQDINSKDGISKIKQFITKKRFEKADKYAREFYHTPMFVEKYKITQAKNNIIQQQKNQAQKIEDAKINKEIEKLNNLKIK